MNNIIKNLLILSLFGLSILCTAQDLRPVFSGETYEILNLKDRKPVDSLKVEEFTILKKGENLTISFPVKSLKQEVGDFFLLPKIKTPVGERVLPVKIEVDEISGFYFIRNNSLFALKYKKLSFWFDEVVLFEVYPLVTEDL